MDEANLVSKKSPGRPKILTDRDVRLLIFNATRNRFQRRKTWSKISNECDLSWASDMTIARAFESAGYSRYIPNKKPHVNAAMRAKRLRHCQEQLEGVARGTYRKILFSDETSVGVGDFHVKSVTRLKSETWHDDCVNQRFKNNNLLMFWGIIGYDYKGPCHVFTDKKKAAELQKDTEAIAEYQEYRTPIKRAEHDAAVRHAKANDLPVPRWSKPSCERGRGYKGGIDWYKYADEIIFPCVRKAWRDFNEKHRNDADVIFMHDGAGAHDNVEVDYILRELQICVFKWPGNSPDLNPIETIWNYLKREIRKKYGPVSKRTDLERVWRQEWELLPIEVINNAIDSYVRHLSKVIELRGGNFYQG